MIGAHTSDYVATLQLAAVRLLEVCDGARQRDNIGFSRADASLGRVVAFTPFSDWTREFAEAAALMLWHYRGTQLSDMSVELGQAKLVFVTDDADRSPESSDVASLLLSEEDLKILAAADSSEANGAPPVPIKVGGGAIVPCLGFENDILTVVSPGYGLDKAAKRSFARMVAETGMLWSPETGVHRLASAALAGDSLTVGQVHALHCLRSQTLVVGDQAVRIDAYLARLALKAMPTPSAHYLRLEEVQEGRPTPEAWVAFPYFGLDRFKAMLSGIPKRFATERVGDGYQKGWWVKIVSPDAAAACRGFALEAGLLCIGGSADRLAELAAAVPVAAPETPNAAASLKGASVAPSELYMDGDRLVIPVPQYSPRFTDWIKATADRMAKFDKNEAMGARWFIPAPKVAAFAVLLDQAAPVYSDCGIRAYAATIEVRRKLRIGANDSSRPVAIGASAPLPLFSVSGPAK